MNIRPIESVRLAEENERLREKLCRTNDIVEAYASGARTIALYLRKYCDYELTYPEMIANAVRRAAAEIEQLQAENERLKTKLKKLRQDLWIDEHQRADAL